MQLGELMTVSLAVLTLIGNIFIVGFLIFRVAKFPFFPRVASLLRTYALHIAFLLATASMVGSLLYSEVVGYPACILCWMQRAFMYPLVPLLAFNLWRKERFVTIVSMTLAIIGGLVALYQWSKDMLALYAPSAIKLGCPAVKGLPSCDRIYILEFGYITIAMLSLNAFILIIIALSYSLKENVTTVK